MAILVRFARESGLDEKIMALQKEMLSELYARSALNDAWSTNGSTGTIKDEVVRILEILNLPDVLEDLTTKFRQFRRGWVQSATS